MSIFRRRRQDPDIDRLLEEAFAELREVTQLLNAKNEQARRRCAT